MDILTTLGIKELNIGSSLINKTASLSGKILTSINPADKTVIGRIQPASAENYQEIVLQAQQAFLSWRQMPAPKRGELVRLIAAKLRAKKDLLGTLVAFESGKTKTEADGEVQEMIDMADFAVGLSRMLYGNTMHSERSEHRLYEQWHPYGPTGIITAFNFPVAVWAWNAFIAVVCGNSVIWKPSPKVSLCALAVQNICHEVMQRLQLPPIFSLFITEQLDLAENLVRDKRLPLISFTGSIAVGKKVASTVAERFGRCILELSGNNAVIIDESADLSLVVPAVLFGAIGTAGQRCTTIRRLLVHASRYDELLAQLIAAYKTIKIGNPLNPDILMGPVIDQNAVDTYNAALTELKQSGGEIIYGGKILDLPGYFVMPTIVRAKNDWSIVQRETFAPILYIIKYDAFAEAIAMNNAVPQGLSSALFTENLRHAEIFLSVTGSDCGIANINVSTSGAEIGGAFGGEKATGGGREAGSDAWKAYMRRQTNTINYGKQLPLAQGIQFVTK